MTPEAKVKEKIKKILKSYSVWYAMPHGAGYGDAGVPDFLCCYQGKFLAIEAKAGRGKAKAADAPASQVPAQAHPRPSESPPRRARPAGCGVHVTSPPLASRPPLYALFALYVLFGLCLLY